MGALSLGRRRRAFATRPARLLLLALSGSLATCTHSVQAVSPPSAQSEAVVETASAPPAPKTAAIILQQGDQPPGGDGLAVSQLGIAVTDEQGVPGFAGALTDGAGSTDGFVWRDGAIVFRSSSVEGSVVAAPAPLIGLGNQGQFVFNTLVDNLDAIWSHRGLQVQQGQQAPEIEPGSTIELSRWPTMTADGTAYWISVFKGERGGGRALYSSADLDPPAPTVVLRTGDEVEGLPIARPRGLAISYQVSDNGGHLIQVLQRETGSTDDDDAVYVDGSLPLIEGQEASSDDSWKRFQNVAINDHGDFLVTGETDGPSGKSTVLAYNGEVAVREGDTLDGRELLAQASVLAAAIDNEGRAAHLWSVAGFGAEFLFFACDAARLSDSVLLLRSNEALTLEDPTLRVAVTRFNGIGHGPAVSLGPGDRLYASVRLIYRTQPDPTIKDAIISLPLPSCPMDPMETIAGDGETAGG